LISRTASKFFSILILFTLIGCGTNTFSPTVTSTNSLTTIDNITPQPTSTPQATPTAQQPTVTLTPGANISFLLLAKGSIQKYNLQNWSDEKLSIQSDGDVFQAVLSPNQRWLALQDRNGIKIVEQPFIGKPRTIPIVQSDRIRLSFSNNSELLAYSDDEGLKIFSILEETSSLLVAHSVDQSDVSKLRFYYPQQWSPNSEWLWIGVSHWEGVSHVLAHVSTKTLHEYTGCYSDMDWFETSKAFVASVRYSGYLGCGEEDGIYLVELKNNNQVAEKPIYQEISPSEAWEHESRDIKLSPDSEKLSFVQLSYPEQTVQSSHLMLIDVMSNEHKELASSQDDISSPIWSKDGRELFYTVQGEKDSQVILLNPDSGEKAALCSLPNRAVLFSDLINDEWLVAGTIINTDWDSLYLVNIHNGTVVKVSTLGYDSHAQPFLGSLPSQ
jgi:hypothetical protein